MIEFKNKTDDFLKKHQNKILDDPILRAKTQKICITLGIDSFRGIIIPYEMI